MEFIKARYRAIMFDIAFAFIEPELRHPANKFLKENLDFGASKRGADAFVRPVAKGVMVERTNATIKVHIHGAPIRTVINP